ncbi:MAG TPA: metal ABC transporter substrate-binding protein [Acidimicrobiia bacterium]|nr:metal ABC transporter substrate-binding protein [Acidimicrobiia bacterium]
MRSRILPALLLLSVLAGCGESPGDEDLGLSVLATTTIWSDVAAQIVGDDGSVTSLIPAGSDAHEYAPTQQQVAALREADLVIANGLGLEAGLEDILESAEADDVRIHYLAPDLDPLEFHHDDDHGDLDPHVWFDPGRVARAAELIADQLAQIDPTIDWMARADGYVAELLRLDEEIVGVLQEIAEERRKLVTNHEALGYFAERYDFEIIGVVIPGGSTLSNPSSAQLARLVEAMSNEEVSTIFAETSQPSRLADAVAAEIGEEVAVVELHTETLGEPGSDSATLIGMLRENAVRISEALTR